MELPGSGEVFKDRGNTPSSHSSESGFTDFVQYQGDGSDEPERAHHHLHPSLKNKPLNKPVMQCCLEHFQQFLSRLITLYIVPGQGDAGGGSERVEVMRTGPLAVEGNQQQNGRVDQVESCPGPDSGLGQRECVPAFTAACQLFLECSSFPVYIAEGNLKATSTPEEQNGKTHRWSSIMWINEPRFVCQPETMLF